MIVAETVIINGKQFVKKYSDQSKYIECDGIMYSEAFDLAEIEKEYNETDVSIGAGNEATESDYITALEDLGVNFNG